MHTRPQGPKPISKPVESSREREEKKMKTESKYFQFESNQYIT
jgi:hypothetical protein